MIDALRSQLSSAAVPKIKSRSSQAKNADHVIFPLRVSRPIMWLILSSLEIQDWAYGRR